MSDDDEGLEEKRICVECVREEYLQAEIAEQGEDAECSYCDHDAKTITIDQLADRIATALEQHYEQTSLEPEGVDWELAKEGLWVRPGENVVYVIAGMAEIDDDPAEDVRALLEERETTHDDPTSEEGPYDLEAQYDEKPVHDYELQMQWNYFQTSLQTESRLFNREAYATLDSIFDKLAEHESAGGDPVVVDAGPGQGLRMLHRARVFQSNSKLESALARPDLELGPPPSNQAAAGRMNAQGIAVFYGATDPDVALAETRPPVGSKVLAGAFEIIRPLRLLDIEALSEVRVGGSVFDPELRLALEKAKFLEFLGYRIAKPVMPDDAPFDYLVTQAIAEYLAGRSEPAIDGIIYPSVQSGAQKNVVLFHKASRVEEMDIPEGTQIHTSVSVTDEEGVYPHYWVSEEVPKKDADEAPEELFFPIDDYLPSRGRKDARKPALRVVTSSIVVRHIESVAFTARSFQVSRKRQVRENIGF